MTGDGLIDIHCHVLPGLDDGAGDIDVALDMLRIAVEDGIRTIVATPHAAMVDHDQVWSGVETLRARAREANLDIKILPGSEVRLSADLAERHQRGEIITLNGTAYALVELSLRRSWPQLLETTVYNAQVAGLFPVLAHAERYPAVQRDPSVLVPLVNTGVPIQVNAESLLVSARDEEHQTALRLLRSRLVHIVASDAHDATGRSPRISDALALAEPLVDPEYAGWIRDVPARLLRGETLTLPEPDLSVTDEPTLLQRFRDWIQR